ncbi:MAG: signal peptidase I, partial [Chloroflexi bacterium]|nr:signal peptidase I [Chloroflexota bacterium]
VLRRSRSLNPNEFSAPPTASLPLENAPDTAGEIPTTTTQPSAWGSLRSFIRETLETIALTLVIFVVIRAGVQNFRIEGYSMEPNFHDGQYLLVSKVDYMLHAPERGDVIIFQAPTNMERDFIKRVIGLSGETVEIREGRVFINGQPLPQNYNTNPGTYSYGPVTVGPDQLFVLGDNRNNSSDSHSWGMLPRSDLIGKAWISYWPPQFWSIIQTPSFATSEPVQSVSTPIPTQTREPYPSY